jgi:ABC-2 type transport system ATP-binding protein
VSKQYGPVRALDECSFSATAGRLTGFLGPNGAGKTTVMRAVFGLVIPDQGEITWTGRVIDPQLRQRFGYMPEERGLYPRMRVLDQLVFFGRLSGMRPTAARREAERWLEALGLTDRGSARVNELSHGNQQRVQLAAALLHSPELVVLDEPFSGLDPFAMDSMAQLLTQVARAGAAVQISSHQLDMVEHLCEDIVVIDSGRVVLQGRLDDIRDASQDRYLDVTTRGPVEPLLQSPELTVVERDDGHLRVRAPRSLDPRALLQGAGRDVVRLSYEPPTLSELFRDAVTRARERGDEAADKEMHGDRF